MKCIIAKEALQKAVSAITKMSNKPSQVVLIAKDGLLSVVSSNDSYVWYSVPAEVEEEGTIGLQFSVFTELQKMRKKELTLTHHKDDNTLQVEGGSRIGVYIMNIDEEQYVRPEKDWNDSIELSSKSVGMLRNMISDAAFTYLISTGDDQASLVNSKEGFSIQFADNTHCAFYSYNKPLSDREFEFKTFIGPIKTILNFLDGKVKLHISESMILFESEQLIVTVSARQDKQSDYITNSEAFLKDENYKEGHIKFDAEKFNKILDSISIVYEDGSSPIKVNVKGNKARLKLESSFGMSEDVVPLEENTIGDFKAAISLMIVQDALACCQNIDNLVTMEVSENNNFYRLTATRNLEKKKDTVQCLNPFVI